MKSYVNIFNSFMSLDELGNQYGDNPTIACVLSTWNCVIWIRDLIQKKKKKNWTNNFSKGKNNRTPNRFFQLTKIRESWKSFGIHWVLVNQFLPIPCPMSPIHHHKTLAIFPDRASVLVWSRWCPQDPSLLQISKN